MRNVGSAAVQATRARYRVVGLAVVLAMLTYLDRACIAVLADDIRSALSLGKTQMGYVFSAFALAYALFEIPTAWWADRVGTRNVLTRIVVWWSAFTMATGAAFSYASLLVTRFLFGMGEAGAWPSVARTFSRWIPRTERGTVQGIFFVGAHLGGGMTPIVVMALRHAIGWRTVFLLFGLIGLIWAAVWYRWFRDDPEAHREVNAAELQLIVAGRESGSAHAANWSYWRRLFGHRNVLLLCLMYFPTASRSTSASRGCRPISRRNTDSRPPYWVSLPGCRSCSAFWATCLAAWRRIGPRRASACARAGRA